MSFENDGSIQEYGYSITLGSNGFQRRVTLNDTLRGEFYSLASREFYAMLCCLEQFVLNPNIVNPQAIYESTIGRPFSSMSNHILVERPPYFILLERESREQKFRFDSIMGIRLVELKMAGYFYSLTPICSSGSCSSHMSNDSDNEGDDGAADGGSVGML